MKDFRPIKNSKPMKNSNEFVAVGQFASPVDANIVKGMLHSNGIPAVIQNSAMNAIIPPPNAVGGSTLLVPADKADEAVALLRSHGDYDM